MELTPKQQVLEVIKSKQSVLLLTHKNPDGDALGSLLAMYLVLKKMGKDVVAVCNDVAPDSFNFLPEIDKITQNFAGSRDFVISLDVSKIKADKVMYKVVENKLEIIVTPKEGYFDKSMLSCCDSSAKIDLIIVLDCPDLERVGAPYEKNPELFFNIPLVNIDHHPGNDQFGKINIVDMTATSTAEVLVGIIEALSGDIKLFDEDVSTALLTGIITDTNSFQNSNTTPKSLTVAAQLVAFGGRQQDIIKNVYKTKSLSTLRLWGRALSNLHDEKSYRFVWTALYKNDFIEVSAAQNEAAGVIDELLKTASGVEFAVLLSERDGDVYGSLRATSKMFDVAPIAQLFGGGGHAQAAAFQLKNTTLLESSENIVSKIRNYQEKG
ncbi:MAG: DHH family phosphoesterase [Candidatus Berkelbacteria bacterium]